MSYEDVETRGRSVDLNTEPKEEIFTTEGGGSLDERLDGLKIVYVRLAKPTESARIRVDIQGRVVDSQNGELARDLESELVKYQSYNSGFKDFSAAKLWLIEQIKSISS